MPFESRFGEPQIRELSAEEREKPIYGMKKGETNEKYAERMRQYIESLKEEINSLNLEGLTGHDMHGLAYNLKNALEAFKMRQEYEERLDEDEN